MHQDNGEAFPTVDKVSEINKETAQMLTNKGFVELQGHWADGVKTAMLNIKAVLTAEILEKIPESINGISIRGKFIRTNTGRRYGAYFGPEVLPYLPADVAERVKSAMMVLKTIADLCLQQFAIQYGLNIEKLRKGTNFDTLTWAVYEKTEDIALTGHTDFGLLTIGISDGDGLEFHIDGKWVPVPAGVVYIHTGSFLQMALKELGVKNVAKAVHRVKNCQEGRTFMGWFCDPAVEAVVGGKTYGKFIEEAFSKTYEGEHAEVKLTSA